MCKQLIGVSAFTIAIAVGWYTPVIAASQTCYDTFGDGYCQDEFTGDHDHGIGDLPDPPARTPEPPGDDDDDDTGDDDDDDHCDPKDNKGYRS